MLLKNYTREMFINRCLSSEIPGEEFERIFCNRLVGKVDKKIILDVYVELSFRCKNFNSNLNYVFPLETVNNYKKRIPDYYPYIPEVSGFVVHLLSRIIKEFPTINSFLDVGAGFGDKVAIAEKLLRIAHGIEYLEAYCKIAKEFGVDLIKMDAFQFLNYKSYDLIYMYHPICNPTLYKKLLKTIMKRMRVGTFLVEVLPTRGTRDILQESGNTFLNLSSQIANDDSCPFFIQKVKRF